MSKIESTIGSSHRIEQVISEAREFVVIVTPYLKITPPLLSRLKLADKRNVKIYLIYGKNDLVEDEKNKLNSFQNLNLYFLSDLHAKCYLNENICLLSSMNLYEYSQINNWELGISLSEEDKIIRDQLLGEIELMLDSSESKREGFKRFALIKKRFSESLVEYLNSHFSTSKFKYDMEVDDFFGDYDEEIHAIGFPNDKINIDIYGDGHHINYTLNYSEKELEDLKEKLNLKLFSDDFRVYHNKPDCISVYNSVYHRDKWDSYSSKQKSEHVSKGIERMTAYLNKLMKEKNTN